MLLFLSHSGADTAAAVELKRLILAAPAARDAGLEIWLDKDELVAGESTWQPQLEEAIARSTAFCVYIGSGGVTNWVEREVRLGLSRATGEGAIPFVPALAAEARSAMLPPFARQHQAVRNPLGDPAALAALVAAALGGAKGPVQVDEPFVGLRSMTETDAHLFFGRDEETAELVEKLRRRPIVAVDSDSGAGRAPWARSSLMATCATAEGALVHEAQKTNAQVHEGAEVRQPRFGRNSDLRLLSFEHEQVDVFRGRDPYFTGLSLTRIQ